MEPGKQGFALGGREIDQKIAAADQVEIGECWIRKHVMAKKDQMIAQNLFHLPTLNEKTGQPFYRDITREVTGWIDASAGMFQR